MYLALTQDLINPFGKIPEPSLAILTPALVRALAVTRGGERLVAYELSYIRGVNLSFILKAISGSKEV